VDISVCIGTFGAETWKRLATDRAIPSVPEGIPVIHEHGATLAKARNAALKQVETEFTVHLDADDELSPDYFDQMAKGTADMRGPALQHIRRGVKWGEARVPQVWSHEHACEGPCLRYGNFLVVGTCARTELVREVGGWEEFGWSEDWALWARCWRAGGTVETIPAAIYIAHHAGRGRNHVLRRVSLDWHHKIEAAVWPDEPSVL
jgi:cellulose synthase/poly-beta-1,6-N-acetylglucosamine synthase-like glycosyltransferase